MNPDFRYHATCGVLGTGWRSFGSEGTVKQAVRGDQPYSTNVQQSKPNEVVPT